MDGHDAQWSAEIARAGTVFKRRIFPEARTEALARVDLFAALLAAHDFLIGASPSAGEIMHRLMVPNAAHDAGEQWAAEAGNAAALRPPVPAAGVAITVRDHRAVTEFGSSAARMLQLARCPAWRGPCNNRPSKRRRRTRMPKSHPMPCER